MPIVLCVYALLSAQIEQLALTSLESNNVLLWTQHDHSRFHLCCLHIHCHLFEVIPEVQVPKVVLHQGGTYVSYKNKSCLGSLP